MNAYQWMDESGSFVVPLLICLLIAAVTGVRAFIGLAVRAIKSRVKPTTQSIDEIQRDAQDYLAQYAADEEARRQRWNKGTLYQGGQPERIRQGNFFTGEPAVISLLGMQIAPGSNASGPYSVSVEEPLNRLFVEKSTHSLSGCEGGSSATRRD